MDHGYITDDPEENAFYAQLTRQILLLTDEEDDLQTIKKSVGRRSNHSHRLVGGGGGGWSWMAGHYFSWSESGEVPVPHWMERLWAAKGGGTGVFIPHGHGGVHMSRRRHNKKPRKNNDRSRGHPGTGHKNL